jgi:FtsH-binding integral membrane protein
MNKVLLQLFGALLIFVCVVFSILNYAIKNRQFTCNRYILNTYLYIILTFNIMAIQLLLMEYNGIKFNPSLMLFIGIFILTLGSIVLLHKISPSKIILKHFVWLVFILFLGLIFYPMYTSFIDKKEMILSAILTTVVLFIGLSALAYLKPEYISLSWGPILLLLLIAGIIMELSLRFIMNKGNSRSKWFRVMSYFFIIVFMVFILYDTKRLQINAKNCVIADYIKESLGLFLDVFNIFVRILSLGR